MTSTIDIKITKTTNSKINELDYNNVPFGKIYSDHMFIADYEDGEWKNFEIKPYGDLALSPATSAIHYGQSIFEGMKAHKWEDGSINIFRASENAKRLNTSAKRMCMPELPEEIFLEALTQLVKLDNAWVPPTEGTSLYIRPYMFATDAFIGVKPSETYKFMIFTCPVGKYYSEPVKVKIEEEYVRSADNGVGFAKAAGNYAASLYPAKLGQEQGYHQLVWTDAKTHEYIEESGTMNIVFQIGDTLITPKSSSTILDGITRRSIVQLAKDNNIKIEERSIKVQEVIDAAKNGTLLDAFGAGTAATIAHVDIINFRGTDYKLPEVSERKYSNMLAKNLMDIKKGLADDTHNWNFKIG